MEWIVIAAICVVLSLVIALPIASIQNKAISECFARRRRHNKLLIGELNIRDIPSSELIALSLPLFTHVGVGGQGPRYNPSFTVYCLLTDEMSRRRELSSLESP